MTDHLDLVALLAEPARASEVPPAQVPPLLCQLAALQSMLAARLTGTAMQSGEDWLLDVKAVKERTGMSTDWLYHHAKSLPFTRRIGRKVLFSEAGLTRWLAARRR